MPQHLRDEAVEAIRKARSVEFIHLWFTDVLGFLKTFAITVDELEIAMNEGMGFDGSSIQGFARIQETDMIALPDPATLQILPWRQDGHAGGDDVLRHRAPRRHAVRGRPALRAEAQPQARRRAGLHVLRRPRARVLLPQERRRARGRSTTARTST